MAKQLNIDLSFTADTKQAEKNIADLSKSLNKIANLSPVEGMNLNKDLQAAVSSAQALQRHLGNAFNVKTGNFDLSRLSQSLKSSNTDLATLTSGLLKAGMQGEQAFMKVQRALSTANVQINKSQSLLSEFATTLKNTARWEISSKVMHGFESAISNAYRYAQNLNKSLTDIRIVTGANADEMARFAVEANNAAKKLSTTTTDYTNASLIYFQQGLSDKEVAERTEVTIKMANAAGVSAQKVSDQMTAVWNNFDDGSKSLEYYADVMTALGAATASSTDEISQGLQKFAAVAETVGLSYEYATAALATVTSETRESADVVGTAYKTLFARIQGLQQGDTLDDGTSLNKYSAALAKVGIDIKDVNGDMKDMDVILNEMGAKWNTLAKDQQLALAQTVAGVRQYTQLVALMDNWDVFQENLNTAYNSEGSLQEQADIYAESWEAAQKRVKASLQEIYNALIPEDFIISFTSGTADVLDGIGDIINGMGGLKTILLLLSSIMLKQFGPSIAQGMSTGVEKLIQLKNNVVDTAQTIKSQGIIKSFFAGNQDVDKAHTLKTFINDIASSGNNASKQMDIFKENLAESATTVEKMSQESINRALTQGVMTDEFKVYLSDLGKVNNLQAVINQMNSQLTEEQKLQLQNLQEQAIAASERHMEEQATLAELQMQRDILADMGDSSVYEGDNFSINKANGGLNFTSSLAAVGQTEEKVKSLFDIWKKGNADFKDTEMVIGKIGTKVGLINVQEKALIELNKNSLRDFITIERINAQINGVLKQQGVSIEEKKKAIESILRANENESDVVRELVSDYIKTGDSIKTAEQAVEGIQGKMESASESARYFAQATGNTGSTLQQGATLARQEAEQMHRVADAAGLVDAKIKTVAESLMNAVSKTNNFSNSMVKIMQGASQVAMGLTTINNSVKTLFNDSATGLEKTSAVISALVVGFTGLSSALKTVTTLSDKYNAATKVSTLLTTLKGAEIKKETAAELANTIATTLGGKADAKAIETQLLQTATQAGGTAAINADTLAKIANTAATWAWLGPVLLVVAAIAAVGLAIWGAVAAYDALTQSEEEAYERSKKAAEELQKSADDAKEAADKLASAFDNYDSAVDKLEECTKGTKEWKKALEDVNEAALEVIDNLPDDISAEDLDALYDRDKKTGQITLNRDEVAKHQSELNERAANADYAASMAKIHSTKAKITLDTSDLADEIALAMNNNGGYVNSEVLQKAITENLDELSGLTDGEFKAKLEALGVQTQYLTDVVLAQYQKRVNQLADSTKAAEEKMRLIAAIKVEGILGDDYDAPTKVIATNVLADREDELKDAYLDLMTSNANTDKAKDAAEVLEYKGATGISQISRKDNEVYQYILKGLQDYAGLKWRAAEGNSVLGNNSNRSFVFRDEKGELTESKDAEWVAETIAAGRALAELTGNAEQAGAALSSMENLVSESDASAIKNMISEGNINSLTEGELSELKTDMDSDNSGKVSSDEAIAYLRKAFAGTGLTGEKLDDYIATMFGKESITQVGESWSEIITGTEKAWGNLADGFTRTVGNILESIDTSSLSMDQAQDLGNLLTQAFIVGGSEGTKVLSDMYTKATEQGLGDKFTDALSDIDWTTITPKGLSEHLNDAGIAINFTNAELQNLIDTMYEAPNSFDSAANKHKTLDEIIKTLKQGDTISAKQLEALGPGMEDYFMRMADGTYKLIGDAEEFYNKVNGENLEGFKKNIEKNKTDNEVIDNLLSYDIEKLGTHDTKGNDGHSYPDDGEFNLNYDTANTQLDLLEHTGYTDTAQIQELRNQLADENLTPEEASKLAEDLTHITEAWIAELGGAEVVVEKLKNEQEKNNIEIENNETAILSTAKSFKDLQKIMSENDISDGSYAKALRSMASQYGSCRDEIANYNTALEEYNENPSEETTNNLTKALKELEEATKKADFEHFVKQTLEFLNTLKDDTWKDSVETLTKLNKAYQDLLDTDFNFSEKFLKSAENVDLLTQALQGNDAAWDQFKINAAGDMFDAAGISGQFRTELDGIAEMIAGYDFSNIEIGASLEDAPFWDALSQMEIGSAESAQAISDALSTMGVDAQIIKHVRYEDGNTQSYTASGDWFDPATGEVTPVDAEVEESRGEAVYTWYTLEGAKYNGKGVTPSGGSDYKPKKSGGGGSKPKKATPTKKSDVVKRYKEIEDQLDDIREEADRVKNSFDKLYGAEQEAAIERLLELEQQEISLMKQKAEEAKKFMQEDLDELMKVSAEVDVEFKVDEKGNLVNYTEEMTELYEELTKLETKAGSEWDQKEQEEISALKEKITKLEEAIAAYEETRELLEDINAELDETAGTPPLPLIKSDYLDVYYEVEDKLDDIEEKIKDLEREAEGLTGEERLEVLRQIQELEEERLKTLEEQKEIARQDMEDKKTAMEEIAERNDLNFEYDENGNITNYISEMEKLNKAYEELYDEVTEDGLVTDTELAALDAMREDMEQMEEYALGYRQAMESTEDIQNEIEDKGSGKANDRFVRSDYIDIYRETEDQLDDIDEKISDLERQADRLTGEERIAKLKEIQKLEKERLEVLKKQKEIAKQDLEDRKAALEEIATVNGLLFEFDENGNITNYEEQLDKKLVKYEEEYTRAMADGVITATEQAILDAIDQDIEELKDAIDAYRDVAEQMEDIQNEMEDISEGGYVDMEQLDEIGDKLHDINQELDDIEEALNDSSEAADRLYGAARIKQMDKTTQMLEKEIDALERKKELQKDIIAEERSEVDTATSGKAQYDSNGNITNYHDLINSRKDAIRAREAELKADGDFTETEAAEIQEMIDDLQRMEEEIDEYEQALEDQEDIENAIDDAYYEWQDLNAEKLSYKLELTLDVNDRELAKIERQISRLEGNFYSRAEALALMVGGGMGGSSKLGQLNNQLGELEAHYAEVKHAYEAGKISHADYVEQTQQLQSEIENTAAEMEALQKQMDSYYKDTLAAARQELSFHISQIEHLTGVLGHYKNILTALGKSQDYEMMGTVLEGQVEALENEVQVAKRAMGMWQKEADEAYAKYQQALASGNQENADMYYQAYQEAINAANEAENKYYSKAQQWAQALKALMENTLAGLAQDLENALTGGTSFETINTQLKRASSLQEEYLTTTNKIYETTKMMRTAQNEIDKTTNSVAKKKLANFITETKQMQNQNKLSKYELSIQQAKYDLLLAEIALEEARFAKSTVRLRRDSEGNFGYVYTADAEAVANAEQKFEDAQNKLYNIGLDGANKYTEKYQQTLSEMYNTLTQLQTKYLQGGFENEAEYNAAVTEAKAYYYEKLGQYSDLYSVALTTDSRVVADAWSTDFADMTQQTENWMNAVTDYLGQVRAAFAEWEQESDRIARETVGTNLETVKQKVAGIVSESDAMVVSINNSVIPAIQSEINEVQRLTDQYAAMNGQMTQAIDNAYALSDALQNDIDASVEKEMANMEAAEQEETQTQLDILTQQYNKTLKAALEDNDISDEEQAKLDAIEREITALQNADSLIAEFEEAYKAAIADEVISDDEQEALNAIAQKLVDLKDEMAALEITNETLDVLIAKIAEVESMESFIEKYRTAYKAALEDDNIISPAEQEGLDAIKEEIAQLRGFDEIATKETNETLSMIADQLTTAQVEENAHAKIVQDILDLISVNIGDLILKVSDIYNGIMSASGITVDTTDPASYDTGGYTGQWGPSGKWAMLHEKELILNKGDTANFLASLDLLDSILSTIDLHAMNSQFNSMINSPYIQGLDTKETLEQMVTIEANFPNATDKSEIEEAFKGLVNLASQYANRK